MQLEQTLEMYPPITSQERVYTIGDLKSLSASVLYSGDSGSFTPLSNGGISIMSGNLGVEGLKDLHDTYSIDRSGNLYGGHTTFNNDFHINTDLLKARADNILKK